MFGARPNQMWAGRDQADVMLQEHERALSYLLGYSCTPYNERNCFFSMHYGQQRGMFYWRLDSRHWAVHVKSQELSENIPFVWRMKGLLYCHSLPQSMGQGIVGVMTKGRA
eukprot:scaffold1635_cov15-Prasinocladus_malaysianus.AAC.1